MCNRFVGDGVAGVGRTDAALTPPEGSPDDDE